MNLFLFFTTISVAFSLKGLNAPRPNSIAGYTLQNITVPIDHYAPNSKNFSLRYYIRTDYYSQTNSGPIFFYCGNEGPIEVFVNNFGFIDLLAQQLDAVVVFAEHRYFGDSLPFGNKSFSSLSKLKYLSPHQALADYAYLLIFLQQTYFNVPVITWGGSYGGMLSAWFRMKYPHLVTGAIASSAPIFGFNGTVDPYLFNAIVTQHFSLMGGSECPAVIKTAYDYLVSMRYNISTYFMLQNSFNTCQDIVTSDDVFGIMNWIYSAFMFMAMADYTSPSSFIQPMPAYPVSVACSLITTVIELDDPIEVFEAVVAGANIFYNYTGNQICNDLNFAASQESSIYQGWGFLSCTTMNIPVASNGKTDMFWNQPWDQTAQDSYCLQTYGEATNVNYANLWYGTSNNQTYILRHASNIVFSSGSLDPWQSGSYLFNNNPNLIAFVMEGGDHVSELMTPAVGDPAEVISGRVIIKQAIQYWVNGTIT